MERYKGSLFILLIAASLIILVLMPAPDMMGVGINRGFAVVKRTIDFVVGGRILVAIAVLLGGGISGAILARPRDISQ